MTEEKNMTRREIREQVFKMLFRVEFYNQEEMSEQIALCEDDACSWKEKDKTYIFEKVEKISEKLEEIDAKINEVSEGWKTGRMGKVDLTLSVWQCMKCCMRKMYRRKLQSTRRWNLQNSTARTIHLHL